MPLVLNKQPSLSKKVNTSHIQGLVYLPDGRVLVTTTHGLGVYTEDGDSLIHYLSDVCPGTLRGVCVDNMTTTVVILQDRGRNPGYLHV